MKCLRRFYRRGATTIVFRSKWKKKLNEKGKKKGKDESVINKKTENGHP